MDPEVACHQPLSVEQQQNKRISHDWGQRHMSGDVGNDDESCERVYVAWYRVFGGERGVHQQTCDVTTVMATKTCNYKVLLETLALKNLTESRNELTDHVDNLINS